MSIHQLESDPVAKPLIGVLEDYIKNLKASSTWEKRLDISLDMVSKFKLIMGTLPEHIQSLSVQLLYKILTHVRSYQTALTETFQLGVSLRDDRDAEAVKYISKVPNGITPIIAAGANHGKGIVTALRRQGRDLAKTHPVGSGKRAEL